jgi:glycosyltransferase involved in cell wall biosynthesis
VSAIAQHAEPLRLGIGIITFNRRALLSQTLDHVLRHTQYAATVVAVADDGSTDETREMLRSRQVLTVTGRNMGIAWNKNRALFLLFELLRCDVVILLEDDAHPVLDNWETEWMRAAVNWGHANAAVDWLHEHFMSGTGTAADPILSRRLSAQCAVFSREAVLFGGYFDTRFHGYGYEHVEHTCRLLRLGYGGEVSTTSGAIFKLLRGGIDSRFVPSVIVQTEDQIERNRALAERLAWDFSYRAPWGNEDEARQFRGEMRHTLPQPAL